MNFKEHARMIEGVIKKNKESDPIANAVYVAIKELTMDSGIQRAIERRNEYYLPDSALQ